MTGRRALVVLGLAAAGLVGATPGEAQEPGQVTQAGWWSQRLGAGAKPEGGVELAWAAEAPQSMAAVQIVVPSEPGEVVLALREVGGLATDQAGIDLCRTTTAWTPDNPGAWSQRPTVRCDPEPPTLGRDETALEWLGSLTTLLAGARPGETVGIALVPRGVPPSAGLPLTTPFQLDLGAGELRLIDTGSPAPSAPAELPPADPGGLGPPGVAAPALGGTLDVAPLGELGPDPGPPTTTVDPTGTEPVALEDLGVASTPAGPGRPWWRLLLLVPLSLAGGGALAWARRTLGPRLGLA